MEDETERTAVAGKSAKGVLLNIAAVGVSKGSGLLFYILLLRVVTPDEGGIYFLYLAVAGIIGLIGAFGMTDSLARFIPFYEGSGRKHKVKPLIYTVLVSFALFSIIMAIALTAGTGLLAQYYSKALAAIVPLIIAGGIVLSLNSLLMCTLLGLKRFGESAFYSASQPVLRFGLAALFFYFLGGGLEQAIYATVLSVLLVNAAMALSLFHRLRSYPGKIGLLAPKESLEIAYYGAAAGFNQFYSSIMSWTDTFVLTPYVAASVVGAYNAVLNIARTLMHSVSGQIFVILNSMLSHLHGTKSGIFGPLAGNAARWSVYITLPIVIGGIFFAKGLTGLLFPVYADHYWLLYAFIPAFFAASISFPAKGALSAVGRSDLLFKSTLAALVLNLVLNVLLVPKYGVVGAAFATSLTYVLGEALAVFYAIRLAKFSFHPLLVKTLVPAGVMAAALALSYNYLFDFSARGWALEIMGMGLASLLSGLIYAAALVKTGGMNKTDYKLVEKTIAKVSATIEFIPQK